MQTFRIPYGTASQTLVLPDNLQVTWIDPADVYAQSSPDELINHALDNPMGGFSWEAAQGTKTVAIAINDNTRPVNHRLILPPLLKKLEDSGIHSEDICFYIANGTHVPLQPDSYSQILPDEMIQKYAIVSHDADDKSTLTFLGTTPANTPVWVNRAFYQSELKIVVGNIEPHHFAGFSGGVKTAAIGLAGRETITANHAMLLEADAKAGIYDGNPLRGDIEQIGKRLGVHLALNIIMNARKEFVAVFFGEPEAVMKAGIPVSRRVSQTMVDGLFDLVITSPGGHPKDINFYQAQKGITHAASIVRAGGTIILCAACPEGTGSKSYEYFMEGVETYTAVLDKYRQQGFQVGPHKAIQVALIGQRAQICLFSEMPEDLVKKLLLKPVDNLQKAVSALNLPDHSRVAILPHATNTIPLVVAQ